MISHLEKTKSMMKALFRHILPGLLAFSTIVSAQLPTRPYPPRLVNDFAEMLSTAERNQLESKLVDFSRRTTTQIVVVTLNDLHGETPAMAATEIGQEWGVGQKGSDNGIVFLIKNKTGMERGQVFIAPGYGLEGIIPDAIAKRIVDNEVLPNFKAGNYYKGIDDAVTVLMKLSLQEFTASEYEQQTSGEGSPLGIIVPLIVFLIIFGNIFGRASRMRRSSLGRSIPFWILLSMLGSGSRRGGGFGNFSSGSGSFGGGGFGGFGGGSFGGGGAGGSW